ncbi:pyridoxal phosphate-dependent aminotransferase [Ornithinimicrobium sp. LYQ103]|uniref:pyridoxal phosphate-dependent aminotransferase n=1 Tax=Ornithinimicrobium sp. LYQ103 TaxID=3378796 RepID=UPI0038531746
MSPARRVSGLAVSPIRRMAVGAPEGTISLALGEPGWPLPGAAREALAEVGAAVGALPYGPNGSRPELVDAVAAWHGGSGTRTVEVRPDQVMVTSGSQAALFALFQSHVEVGGTVLVPDPGFVSYLSLAQLCQARAVGYRLADDWSLDAAHVVAALDAHPETSVVVVNHPANPTGGMATAAALATVAEACARRGVVLVSDEVYRELYLDERPAGLHDVYDIDAGVVLGSVSKAWGAPGLRVGWAVGSPDVLAPARVVHNAMTTAAARPSQDAALALLRASAEVLAEAREHVRRRWATAERVAPRLLGVRSGTTTRPVGTGARAGFYLWLPLPDGTPPQDTTGFALRVRDESRVTTVPGDAFGPGGAGWLRVSLGGPLAELEEGLARLAPWWKA